MSGAPVRVRVRTKTLVGARWLGLFVPVLLGSSLFACATGGAPEIEGFDAVSPRADGATGDAPISDGTAGDAIDPDAGAADGAPDASPSDAPPTEGGTKVGPHEGTAFVSAGGVMTSPGFKMISTLGQSSLHQGTMTSPSYRLRGGLVGATGGK